MWFRENTLFHEILAEQIVIATQNVVSTMFGHEIVVGETRCVTSDPGPTSGLAAIIGLAGNYTGSGIVACTEETACHLAGFLLMDEFKTVNEEVLDAMGEIGNMIIGNVKSELETRLGMLGLSTPTVIHGSNFAAWTSGSYPWTVVPFQCDGHRFSVQMMLVENRIPLHSRNFSGPVAVHA